MLTRVAENTHQLPISLHHEDIIAGHDKSSVREWLFRTMSIAKKLHHFPQSLQGNTGIPEDLRRP